jgi:hypothetical protein
MADFGLTAWTAIYAALVSTATAAWTIYKDTHRDRGRLRLEVGFRELIDHRGIEHDIIVYRITNVGTKPVMVTNVGGLFKGGKGFIVNDHGIPKKLDPGEFHSSLLRDYTGMDKGVTALTVYDSLGRTYWAGKKDVKAVNTTIAELKAKGITKSWLGKRDD